MSKKLLSLAVLPLIALAASAGEAAPAPAKKSVSLQLTADSTRDDVIAAMKSQGIQPTDAQVDQVMTRLAAAKKGAAAPAAPAATPGKKSVKLTLTGDSTREDVQAALKAGGAEPTDAMIDQVMTQLAALKKGSAEGASAANTAVVNTTPGGTTVEKSKDGKQKPKLGAEKRDTTGLHGYLLKKLPGMDLEYRPQLNQYHSEVLVNGKPADFLVDSGAHTSTIATEFCVSQGIKTASDGTSRGIGGEASEYMADIDSLAVGPHIRLKSKHMKAVSMANTRESDGVNDGLIGADILSKIGGLIDYRNHRLAYPAPKTKPDIAGEARKAGFREITLKDGGVYSILETTIAGKPMRFVVDTGAQQSVLDANSAKSLGLTTVPSAIVVQGIGNSRRTMELAAPEDILIADGIRLHRMPMIVMPLDHVQMKSLGHFDGILGADFLYASGVVFDVGNHKFYLKPGVIDVRGFTKTGGEMFHSDAELKKVFAATPRVLAGKVTSFGLMDKTTTDAKGTVWRAVQVVLTVGETLKGTPVPAGEKETFYVLLKDSECGVDNLTGLFSRNIAKIVFLGEKPKDGKVSTTLFDETVWTDGELPRAQLKRILK